MNIRDLILSGGKPQDGIKTDALADARCNMRPSDLRKLLLPKTVHDRIELLRKLDALRKLTH